MVDWDLVVIALLAEEEEHEEYVNKIRRHKMRRTVWVEETWRERCTLGEYYTLCKNLPLRGVHFYDYYKVNYEKFEILVNLLRPHIQKHNTNYRPSISVEERLTICLR